MEEFRSLKDEYPELAAEWHPVKNGTLTPETVTPGSNRKVWWFLPYDDPVTGKHHDFEWEATVWSRTKKGNKCPYLSGRAVWPGYNDLATLHPDVAAEWHPTKNGTLTPEMVTANSKKKVWWMLPYDDPSTGKHFDFEWRAQIVNRTYHGTGCPYLSGRTAWPGYNDLGTSHPGIAALWHPDRNGDLTPQQVTAGIPKRVWWLCRYEHPETGEVHVREWQQSICTMTKSGIVGPEVKRGAVWPGYNDLMTTHPDLAMQWHPDKNGDLTPRQVSAGFRAIVWWLYPYDDPATGKHFDFEWQASVRNRSKEPGCPFLSNMRAWPGYNDLGTTHPELARQWDPVRNGEVTPEQVVAGSEYEACWLYPYDDPLTGKHFDFSWRQLVLTRTRESALECPFLSNIKVWPGYNDIGTTHPDVAAQWHPVKNGNVTSEQVTAGSEYEAWWLYPYDDPATGKHFEFEWKQAVRLRTADGASVCPYLTGKRVWRGFNDLATRFPDIAAQWHPSMNGEVKPQDITAGSHYRAWWLYPYDDPATGKHFDFVWRQDVRKRTEDDASICPFLTNQKVWRGFNDLATTHPEIARQWDLSKNGDMTPEQVVAGSTYEAWWLYPYDDPATGGHFDFSWKAPVCYRIANESECPFLTNQRVWIGFNDLATTHPEIARQWHPSLNHGRKPTEVIAGSNTVASWLYPYDDPKTGKHHDFVWESTILARTTENASECPFLSNRRVWPGYNDLASLEPEIAAQLHPIKNYGLKADRIYVRSSYRVWWKCPKCGREWKTSVVSRTAVGTGCPYCTRNKEYF